MKRLPDNVHGGGADSVYETEPFGTSVTNLTPSAVGDHLESQGLGNFVTVPAVGGLSVYKPSWASGKYCVRVNYYDARSLTEAEMADLEAAIKATPEKSA